MSIHSLIMNKLQDPEYCKQWARGKGFEDCRFIEDHDDYYGIVIAAGPMINSKVSYWFILNLTSGARYDYEEKERAFVAWEEWDGINDPIDGWSRKFLSSIAFRGIQY